MHPWYTIENIDKLEINVLFEGKTLAIKSIYNFHINLYAQIVKKYPDVNIVITHKDDSSLSRARASQIYARFAGRLQVPYKRISVNRGLPPAYQSQRGEKVVIFLRKSSVRKAVKKLKAKNKVRRLLRTPPKKKEYVYIKRIKKDKPYEYSLMGGLRQYNNFTNTSEEFSGLLIGGSFRYRLSENLHFVSNLDYVLPGTTKAESNEHHYAFGVESAFTHFSSITKIYARKNWAWVFSQNRFATVYDYGFHQGLDFKLVKKPDYSITLGLAAEASLSNNISGVRTANVYSVESNLKYINHNANIFASLYLGQRKYKVFDVDILGFNMGYTF